ncbi:hypothetical protein KHA96_11405 [Bacillus sp. FJAT-49711]|uniref:hypothetical protein n=1 Tax=Bacillus sp. FJAT-49711 TaxID=2833585 RepID=UPI001BC98936|nr:hypothetical protein [Bacillus sp. FJAT-49711]MBS4218921.1 hypothetical protein [Bacillus sp. FJAT-49711]
MSFKGLAKRTKVTKKNKNGKFQSKKRFGKSIGSYAPALLMTIIKQKLIYIEKELHEINTYSFKASQYNHVTDSFKKKKHHQQWSYVGDHKVQRDLDSAFLIMNSQSDGKSTNREYCIRTFKNFLILHNNQMEQLNQHASYLPSSMGLDLPSQVEMLAFVKSVC